MKQKLLFFFFIGLLCMTNVLGQSVFINEIHYDNDSTDIGEAIEIAGPSNTDLSGWELVLYNGSNSSVYNQVALSGSIPNQQNGYGTVLITFPTNGLQNGAPDGVALVDNTNNVVQFLSYEGTFTAVGGVADGLLSTDIGVAESPSTPVGASLTLTGTGFFYEDFTWEVAQNNSYGAINAGQSFGEPILAPIINEFVFNHTGGDTNEFVEVFAPANTGLSSFWLLEIEGDSNSPGTIDEVIQLGTTDANGYFTTEFLANAFENGTVSLLLVSNFTGNVGDDLDTDDDGILDATPWEAILDDIGVNDGGSGDFNYSQVVLSQGFDGISFTVGGASRIPNATDTDNASDWVRNDFDGQGLPDFPSAVADNGEAINTPAAENETALVVGPVSVLINELDVDTPSTDTLEFLELYDGGSGNTALDGLVLVLYNGNGNASYNAIDLDGFSTNAEGYFVIGNADVLNVDLVVGSNAFQNGEDAIALYVGDATDFPSGTPVTTDGLVDAIVYGTDDPDATELLVLLNEGQLQLNENTNGDKDNESMQRIPNGDGGVRNTDAYVVKTPTPGTANDAVVNPGEIISIADARAITEGNVVTITGILTVSDNFGGPAYIQDDTGAIAIFDAAVHGEGVFAVGDSITVTGTRSSFRQLQQLNPVASVEKNPQPTESIEPRVVTLAELGNYPGELVQIQNVSFPNPGDLFFGNSNYSVTDTSGSGELRLDNDVADLVGKVQPDSCGTVTGVVGRFEDTFQLLPRSFEDVPCAETFVPPGDNLGIPKDETFDVVTWNIEWFGDEGNSPAAGNPLSDAIQRDSVLTVLNQLDADVYAVQEIADDTLFAELVGLLPGYDFVLSEAVSNPTGTPPFQKVGFIYKTETVNPVATRPLLQSIHPLYNGGDDSALVDYPSETDRFYASGRLPFLMTADVTIDGVTEQLDLIALHARANSGTDAQNRYDMRKYDVEVLKDSLDVQFADRKLILLGDYNDDVDETVADIPSTLTSFEEYVNDTENYRIISSLLSEQGFRSFVFRENMIDHIAYTNELFENYIEESVTVHYEVFDNDYSSTASDHFPVSARFQLKGLTLDNIATVDVSCNGDEDGSITVEVSGGVAPYEYLWSDGQITETAIDLKSGEYSVIVTDALDNSILSETIVVSEPEAIDFSVPEDAKVYLGYRKAECTNLSVSNIINAQEVYTIVWSTGETSEEITVCPKENTTYTVTVTDENGCSTTKEIVVEAVDVSCGSNRYFSKVQICFNGRSYCVSEWAAQWYLKKGAVLGSCDGANVPVFSKVYLVRNPVFNEAKLYIDSKEAVVADFELYDLFGRLVLTSSQNVTEGKSFVRLDVSQLRRGLYFLKPSVDGQVQKTIRLLKW
ncbi:T9SS type A sorting domain-containing protein [Flagellimonas sp. 389]|uniref:DUF5689 domain-containing protein n=1 Tax=Flagellimonas sp. 389 TaxID=2835862 RepID=UPI001BD5ADC0|nr:DUF5689 domain-containing protein [Flagellimonas sp. 389]MBS9462932.1 T9SS type A sorting domain-containing protein [Flagellimonas sp. 389]